MLMRIIPLAATALAISFSAAVPLHASGDSINFRLSYIGHQIVPNKTRFNGTIVGGLSSLDYNPATGNYLTISDDRSKTGPARFYELSLDLSQFQSSAVPGMAGVIFHTVTTIQQVDGGAFEKHSVDPEGMRFDSARNKIYWCDEGQRSVSGFRSPAVREMNSDGSHSREFSVPSYYAPHGSNIGILPGDNGIYNNLAFESLAISVDGAILYTATENGLVQDSPPATILTGSRSRILSFDIASGKSGAEYIYYIEPVAFVTATLGGFATNGLSDFIAIGDRQFITIERSFALDAVIPGGASTGFTVRLYYADARDATDVSGVESLARQSIRPVRKTLLVDLSQVKNKDGSALALGNIEGITLGPRFNGKNTIVLVADDNFNKHQLTQFIALEINSD